MDSKLTTAIVLTGLLSLSSLAMASGGGEALFAFLGLGLLIFIWPLVMPLFFIKRSTNKIAHYFILLIFIYGISGLINLPISAFSQISIWFSLESFAAHSFGVTMVMQVLAFALALIALKKYNARIMQFIEQINT